jgi:hypothetical protein
MSSPPAGPTPAEPRDALGTVLVIEDHPIAMELVEALLASRPGLRILKAFTGREGIRLALAENPDLVLLDMRLPDIGGLEVVRSLSEAISRRAMRIILLTGESFSVDVVKAMSLGAHEYWPKPLDVRRLDEVLSRLLHRPPGPASGD